MMNILGGWRESIYMRCTLVTSYRLNLGIELLMGILQVRKKKARKTYNTTCYDRSLLHSTTGSLVITMNRSLSIHLHYLGVRYWNSLQYYQYNEAAFLGLVLFSGWIVPYVVSGHIWEDR